MASNKSYYEILGVTKTSTPSEIKKAYKRLVIANHPDKLPPDQREEGTKKIKEINEAYGVLSDPEKKKIYDRYGKKGLESGGGFDPFSMGGSFMEEIFKQQQQRQAQVPPIKIQHIVTLEEIFKGLTIEKKFSRYTLCDDCSGTGFSDKQRHECVDCKGRGRISRVVQIGPGMIQKIQTACPKCSGSGMDKDATKCKKCKGKRVVEEQHKLSFVIPPGVQNKSVISEEDEGHEIPIEDRHHGLTRGRVELIVLEKHHPTFSRGVSINGRVDPADLKMDVKLTLQESLCGFKKEFTHLNGEKYCIFEDTLIKDGDIRTVPGKGLPSGKYGVNGNLFIRFQVEYPKKLSIKQKADIYKILTGKKLKEPEINKDIEILNTLDVADLPRSEAYDNNSDQEGVECVHQ